MRALEATCKHPQQRCPTAHQVIFLAQVLTGAEDVWGNAGRKPAERGCHGDWPRVLSSPRTVETPLMAAQRKHVQRQAERTWRCPPDSRAFASARVP